MKRKLNFEKYKNGLGATQLENKINYLEKIKINIDSFKNNHKQFIRNKSTLKTQQIFKSKRHNVFTEEINKIAQMMIKECNQFIRYKHIHTERESD